MREQCSLKLLCCANMWREQFLHCYFFISLYQLLVQYVLIYCVFYLLLL